NGTGAFTAGNVNLTTEVTGVLPVLNGGTGQSTYTDGQLLIGNSTGNTLAKATLTGTANRLAVTNGSGAITLNVDPAYVGQNTITTLGTVTTGVWNGTTVAVANGGTGQTSYTDGQLLIGNTTGNTLAKATLTAGAGIGITNGNGTISIAATGVASVTGTANRISIGGTATNPTVDIDAAYVGQNTITTLGTETGRARGST